MVTSSFICVLIKSIKSLHEAIFLGLMSLSVNTLKSFPLPLDVTLRRVFLIQTSVCLGTTPGTCFCLKRACCAPVSGVIVTGRLQEGDITA